MKWQRQMHGEYAATSNTTNRHYIIQRSGSRWYLWAALGSREWDHGQHHTLKEAKAAASWHDSLAPAA